jgi:hypothetical protein
MVETGQFLNRKKCVEYFDDKHISFVDKTIYMRNSRRFLHTHLDNCIEFHEHTHEPQGNHTPILVSRWVPVEEEDSHGNRVDDDKDDDNNDDNHDDNDNDSDTEDGDGVIIHVDYEEDDEDDDESSVSESTDDE